MFDVHTLRSSAFIFNSEILGNSAFYHFNSEETYSSVF